MGPFSPLKSEVIMCPLDVPGNKEEEKKVMFLKWGLGEWREQLEHHPQLGLTDEEGS
jgi:hypothetical protein